ncbi:MAG: AhpC/TSA family protein [Okeania sp. SIO2G4]|uniref:peroxiredoxin-like family protein n=1 Tax=unclassified Okeania TaxID=2634635 RepID=UPI0013B76E52|nr:MULTISPECIES: peroxiredoxin-like family protein [unclassified Okeania]NEP04203.1 AhpC/TSA family protein [Okeania sp. SIO4D6]NEP38277.1 AhpC/TSA family protein [Okeania sp. SIO2H7]NEP73724.1 AhpC/TSA family protein [Okeania sp. SIO2G5]NEP96219.1 AhpC/TSA family protein [Okeania sp. SIO2F5]NEQ92259.1 AhpC/TSA family protein [Okeania sp. SIO2G4]
MELTKNLQQLQAEIQAQLPEDAKEKMNKAVVDLANSDIVDNSLKVGEKVPNFSLPNAVGKIVELNSLLVESPVVISFYRGGWCPYCNMELRGLQKYLPQITELGAKLIAISPETADNSLSTTEKNELTFEVLSDRGNQVAKEFGLVFQLPEELRPIYQSFGIDLPAYNGDESFELPIPATYVVASDGTIIHAFVNPDYTQRLDPEEIINVLEKVK